MSRSRREVVLQRPRVCLADDDRFATGMDALMSEREAGLTQRGSFGRSRPGPRVGGRTDISTTGTGLSSTPPEASRCAESSIPNGNRSSGSTDSPVKANLGGTIHSY